MHCKPGVHSVCTVIEVSASQGAFGRVVGVKMGSGIVVRHLIFHLGTNCYGNQNITLGM